MKKSLLIAAVIAFVAILSSCASIPKKVKDGDTLLIGRTEVYVHDYPDYQDVKINGIYYDHIELTISCVQNNSKKIVRPNKDGYFYITGLTPHYSYYISSAKFTAGSTSGYYYTITLDMSSYEKDFIPYENAVVNMGCLNIDFNGENNYANWSYSRPEIVKANFDTIDSDSQWHDMDYYEQ